jgi:single-stranded DNA-binding protein
MGNRFHAYLAGRIATEPTLGTTKDGRAWTTFRLAVDDRLRSAETGEWETAQTIFHDVAAFGRLAERTFGTRHVGDAVIAHGEFRFRSYEDAAGTSRLGASFVASRIGPDLLLADVTVARSRERRSAVARPDPERPADLPSPPAPSVPVARRRAL